MKDVILRMPNAPAWIDAGKSLGASVTPIAYAETYTALQTGTVAAQDNPLPGTKAMKFYEVTKQISLTKHIIDVKLLCVTNKVWNADDQAAAEVDDRSGAVRLRRGHRDDLQAGGRATSAS